MRNRITTAIAALLVAGMFISPAKAEDVQHKVYVNIQNNYVYQDIPGFASRNPVAQGGITTTIGCLSIDVWTSLGLSAVGEYGHRGGQDEWDLTIFCGGKVNSPIGLLNINGGGAIYAVPFGKGDIRRISNETAYTWIEAERPFQLGGGVEIAPFVRPSAYEQQFHCSGNTAGFL